MKILVLGGGGREHAIADVLLRSGHQVYCHPGNAGTQLCCSPIPDDLFPTSITDPQAVVALAGRLGVDLTVSGPEAPLAAGVADAFAAAKMMFFGPTQAGARLEASKAYTKEFLLAHNIPCGKSVNCSELNHALEVAAEYCTDNHGVVIKPSGLTGGKGVTVCDTFAEADFALRDLLTQSRYGSAGNTVVVEERLSGQEVSLLVFCDGTRMVPMLPLQDHKRLGDGDTGPNTGGMGAYCPTPFANESLDQIVMQTQQALLAESLDYRGVLYFGFIMTEQGPKILEFNCRFGDPETQALLPLLTSDLGETLLACASGDIRDALPVWGRQTACTVVLASSGYPDNPILGKPIQGILDPTPHNARVFHASTRRLGHQVVTSGGRVATVTGLGGDLEEARAAAYAVAEGIHFDGKHYRRDIGHHALELSQRAYTYPT